MQTPTATLESFLEAMDQAVDKQREEKTNLVNGVWTCHDCLWALNPVPLHLFIKLNDPFS